MCLPFQWLKWKRFCLLYSDRTYFARSFRRNRGVNDARHIWRKADNTTFKAHWRPTVWSLWNEDMVRVKGACNSQSCSVRTIANETKQISWKIERSGWVSQGNRREQAKPRDYKTKTLGRLLKWFKLKHSSLAGSIWSGLMRVILTIFVSIYLLWPWSNNTKLAKRLKGLLK